jgi:hypothetical protein
MVKEVGVSVSLISDCSILIDLSDLKSRLMCK